MPSRIRNGAFPAPTPALVLFFALTSCTGDEGEADASLSGPDTDVAEDAAEADLLEDLDASDAPQEEFVTDSEPDVVREPLELPTCEELLGEPIELAGHHPGNSLLPAYVDANEALGLPAMYGMTASWGDINSDGLIDLFVPGWVGESTYRTTRPPERFDSIFFGCGRRFYEHRIEPTGNFPSQVRGDLTPHASHVADMDGDGRADLLFSVQGDLYIYYQTEFGFESTLAWRTRGSRAPIVDLTVVDIDHDGLFDIYGSVYGDVNILLQGTETRGEFVDHSFDSDAHAAATSVETFAAAYIPRRDPAEPALLYFAHHAEPDQIWTVDTGFRLELRVDGISPNSSMGVDYFYPVGDERVVAAVSEEGNPHFIFRIDAEAAEPAHPEAIFPPNLTEWGLRFSDFNNDGGMDLVYACAPTNDDGAPVESIEEFPLKLAVADPERDRAGELQWVDASATAGPSFDGAASPNYYGLGAADIELDGCVDLVIAPAKYEFNNPASVAYFGPITVLRNSCGYPGNWIGFLLEDPGAMIALDIDYRGAPMRLWADSQAGSSVGGESASEQVHFGLGGVDRVLGVEVRCSDGRTNSVDAVDVELNTYNDIQELCPRNAQEPE